MKSIFEAINTRIRKGANYTIICDDVASDRLTNITGCSSITLDA